MSFYKTTPFMRNDIILIKKHGGIIYEAEKIFEEDV